MADPTPPPPEPPAAQAPEYEFSEEQNKTIGAVATGFWVLGLILLIEGTKLALRCIGGLIVVFRSTEHPYVGWTQAVAFGALSLLLFPMGIWFMSAAGSFQAIVDTRGHDIRHLMAGLGSLARSFAWITGLALFALAIGVVMFVLNLFGTV